MGWISRLFASSPVDTEFVCEFDTLDSLVRDVATRLNTEKFNVDFHASSDRLMYENLEITGNSDAGEICFGSKSTGIGLRRRFHISFGKDKLNVNNTRNLMLPIRQYIQILSELLHKLEVGLVKVEKSNEKELHTEYGIDVNEILTIGSSITMYKNSVCGKYGTAYTISRSGITCLKMQYDDELSLRYVSEQTLSGRWIGLKNFSYGRRIPFSESTASEVISLCKEFGIHKWSRLSEGESLWCDAHKESITRDKILHERSLEELLCDIKSRIDKENNFRRDNGLPEIKPMGGYLDFVNMCKHFGLSYSIFSQVSVEAHF